MTYNHTAKSRFNVTSWSEENLVDIDSEGTKAGETYYPSRGFSRAAVSYTYTGDLEATSTLGYLIAYRPDGAPVIGFEQVTGILDGHEGSFVVQHTGYQDAGSVKAHLEIVAGLGTGGLEGLRGEAELAIEGHSEDGYELVWHYDLT